MDGVLIAGARGLVFNTFAEEAKNHERQVLQALITDSNGALSHFADAEKFDWNSASPVSARNLVIAAENRLECFNTAILIAGQPSKKDGNDFTPLSIETLVNNFIKGPMFLVHELYNCFLRLKQGTIVLVLPYNNENSLLGAPITEAWRAFTLELLSFSPEPVRTMGFFCEKEPEKGDDFASFVFKTMDSKQKKDTGKLFKYKNFPF